VTAERVGKGRGATVTVQVAPVPEGRELHESGWEVEPRIKRGRRTLLGHSAGMQAAPGPGDFERLQQTMDEVLSAGPDVPVRIRVSIRRYLTSPWESPVPLERVLEDAERAAGAAGGQGGGK
jgi:hypothetical protein